MREYFLVYQMGLERGISTVLLYLAYLAMLVLLLSDCPRSWKDWAKRLGEIALLWGIMQVFSAVYYALCQESYLNQAHEVAATILYAALRSRYPYSKRIVMGCAAWSSEMLLIGILGSMGLELALPELLILVGSLVAVTAFLRYFAVEEFLLAPKYHVAVVFALALCGIISSANWGGNPGQYDIYMVMTDFVLLVTLLLVYYLFYYINTTYQQNQELIALQQKMRANEEVLALTQKNREEMRILRHELKNHDAYIRGLLSQKRYDELETYVQRDVSSIVRFSPQVDSGNQIIDAIINEKIALGEISSTRIDCRLAVPETLPFGELELSSMLSNLLDNALEACAASQEQEKVIQLTIYQQRGYLFIHMENPFPHTVSNEERLRLATTKPNQIAHGYGTKVIQRVVRQYNGEIQYTIQRNRFISDAMLALTGV